MRPRTLLQEGSALILKRVYLLQNSNMSGSKNGDHERIVRTSSIWEEDEILYDLEAGNLPPLGVR